MKKNKVKLRVIHWIGCGLLKRVKTQQMLKYVLRAVYCLFLGRLWRQSEYISSMMSETQGSGQGFALGSNPGSGRKCPRLRWDPWARHRTPNCSPGAAQSHRLPTAPLGWVKCREHISLLIIIVYVTNKAHLSIICCCTSDWHVNWPCEKPSIRSYSRSCHLSN